MQSQTLPSTGHRPVGRVLQVVRTRDLTPHMRRVTLGGDELAGADDGQHGPNVKLFLPRPGQVQPILPTRDQAGRIVWPSDDERPTVRTYTARRYDPDAREIDIDFVLHGAGGIASGWAEQTRPGETIGVSAPGGLSVRASDWYLLAGDHAALPAIGLILEKLPPAARGVALIEVPDAAEQQPLPTRSGIEVRWLVRSGAGPEHDLLADACRAVAWPDGGSVFAWVGAESSAVRTIRRYLDDERRLDRRRKLAIGYWKRGLAEDVYHERHDNDREAEDKFENQHDDDHDHDHEH